MKNKIIKKEFTYENIKYCFYGLPDEHIFKHIPWYEIELLKSIKNLNLEGVYIDVGGNIGNHSLYFLNHCKSTELFVFEPEDFCYNILNKNLKTNTLKKYSLYKLAVWNHKTNLKLIRFKNFNNTGISKVIESNNINDLLIEADTLDNIIPFDKKVVLIKIDTEGSESEILNGSINIIKKNKSVIICEASTQSEFNKINDILVPLGYKIPSNRFNSTPTYIWTI